MIVCWRAFVICLGCLFSTSTGLAIESDSLSAFFAKIDSLAPAEARLRLKESRKQLATQKQWIDWAEVSLRLIDLPSSAEELQQGIEMVREVRQTIRSLPEAESRLAKSHMLQGESFFRLQMRDSSLQHLQQAWKFYASSEESENATRTALGIGNHHLVARQFQQAGDIFTQALTHIQKQPDMEPQLRLLVYNNLVYLYLRLGEYDQALTYAPKALEFSLNREGSTPLQLIRDLTNAGVLYRRLGDFDRAELYLVQALEEQKRLGNPDFASHNNLGALYLGMGEYDSAVVHLQLAIEAVSPQAAESLPNGYLFAYQNLADAYLKQGQLSKVRSLLDQTLRLHQQDSSNIEMTWLQLAKYYQAKDRPTRAFSYLQQGLRRFSKRDNPDPIVHSELYRLEAELNLPIQPEASLTYCKEAIRTLTPESSAETSSTSSSLDPRQLLQILVIQGKAYEALSQTHEDSIQYLQAALGTWTEMDSLSDRFLAFYPMEGAQYQLLQFVKPAYQSAIRIAFRLYRHGTNPEKYAELGYYFSEKSKAAMLQARLRENTALQMSNIPETMQDRDRELRANLSFYQDRLFQERQRANPDTAKLRRWNQQIIDLQRAKDVLLDSLKLLFPSYYEFRYQTEPASFSQLRDKLSKKQTHMLMYSVGEQFLFTWFLPPESDAQTEMAFSRIPIDSSWKASLSLFTHNLRDHAHIAEYGGTKEFWQAYLQDAHHWYQQLLQPVLPTPTQATQGNLLIVPDGLLGYLPFELLLPVPSTEIEQSVGAYHDLPFLILNWRIRYEYAASLLIHPTPNGNATQGVFAVAPAYDFSSQPIAAVDSMRGYSTRYLNQGWQPLEYNQAEVQEISQLAKGYALFGREAQEASFRTLAEQYQVLHLAMHAFTDDENPLQSGLVFSPPSKAGRQSDAVSLSDNDGILFAHELYNLPLNAELAVLSACNTGTGKLAAGEGILSLARAFKYAGVPNTVMSLWQADDKATAKIMTNFYQQLQSGIPKHEALRLAKLDYLQNNKQTHPFFWATFVLYGDDEPVSFRTGNHLLVWGLALGMLVLLVGVIVFIRKRNLQS